MRGLLVLATLACFAAAQHQALIDYLEQRLLAIEVRPWLSAPCRSPEFQNPGEKIRESSLGLGMGTGMQILDGVGTRVDRVERELDYLETQNGVQPCVDVDDKLIEQQVTLVQEKQKAKYVWLSDCSDMISSIKAMKILKR
ncbi:unnamed protein product, partial [Tetraodon nigroviridis]